MIQYFPNVAYFIEKVGRLDCGGRRPAESSGRNAIVRR